MWCILPPLRFKNAFMKSKLLLPFLTLLVLVTPFSKAEEETNFFKIADAQINEQFEVKEDDSKTLGGVKLHDFTITCKKSVLDLIVLKGKEKVHNHPLCQERTIEISHPLLTVKQGEKAHIILNFPPISLLGNYNTATFDVKDFDSAFSDPSKNVLSHLPDELNQPIDNSLDQPYAFANAPGKALVPFSINDVYDGVDWLGLPYLDKYTLHINVAVSVNDNATTEKTLE